MAIICCICKKEVELVTFGNGLVGTCCNRVLYNSEDKPRFVMEEEKKRIALSAAAPKRKKAGQKCSAFFLLTAIDSDCESYLLQE